ncbi:unnamed protein product [Lactuca saligna]|uniref:Uncharacterized protein n=1 Tax=Lactuca saligna TaxID=75948 RepID=A0AA35YDB7_LACSI|nr:unnamed protein product [Lactuca saligna]
MMTWVSEPNELIKQTHIFHENLTKIVNVSFQKVFAKLEDLQEEFALASKARPLVAKGGEGVSTSGYQLRQWQPSQVFQLRDKTPITKRLMKRMMTCLMVSK